MITIDVCWIEDIDDQNLNIAKSILKLKQAEAFPGSNTWIRINPSYAKSLEQANLIQKNEENKNFVQLTQKGKKIKVFNDTIEMSLEEYFIHEQDIDALIETSLLISITKSSYKIMHNTCHSCNKDKTHLVHYIDHNKNDGMYCTQCLNKLGYIGSIAAATKRRTEARNAFSIR
jgi:predicted transcriptional regulator